MNDKIPGNCKECSHLKKKEKHYCNEGYWDNHLGMIGTPATDEIADNCKCNCVDHLCNVQVECCNTQIRIGKLQKKNVLKNSNELTQAFYKIRDFIKEKKYSHSVSDMLKFHTEYLDYGQYASGSVDDVGMHCRRSIENLYKAGYRG